MSDVDRPAADDPERSEAVSVGEEATRPVRSLTGATMLSRVLGLVRDKVTVFLFPEATASAIVLAWTIPNMFRRLFGEGALAAALLPVLARTERREGTAARDRLACSVMTGLVAVLLPLTALLVLGLALVPSIWWERLFESPEIAAETVRLSMWMMPYLLFVCVGAQLQGLANLARRFFVPAVAPAVVNLFWIFGALAAAASAKGVPDAQWVAIAVLFAGVLQVWMQAAELRRAGVWLAPRSFRHPEVAEVARVAVPMMLGMAAVQVNLLVDRMVAEALVPGDGAIRHLYISNRLMQLPLGLVGVALSTAAYPVLTRCAAAGDERGMASALARGLRFAAVLALPAMLGLCVLARPILAALFQGGEFTSADVDQSASCLVAYAPTLVFQTVILLLTRADYARLRHSRVLRVSLIAMGVNVALDFALAAPLGATGVAMATSIATLVNLCLLARGIDLNGLAWARSALAPAVPLLVSALVMAAGVLGVRALLERSGLPEWQTLLGIELPLLDATVVVVGVAVGAVLYFALARSMARSSVDEVLAVFWRRSS